MDQEIKLNIYLYNSQLLCTGHCPSYICDISNIRTPTSTGTSTSGAPRSTAVTSLNRHLELFIFLEDTNERERSGLGKNCQWKHSFELHHKLRGAFQNLAVEHSKKFHQAVHSALNRVICNYGSHAKVCECSTGWQLITRTLQLHNKGF